MSLNIQRLAQQCASQPEHKNFFLAGLSAQNVALILAEADKVKVGAENAFPTEKEVTTDDLKEALKDV